MFFVDEWKVFRADSNKGEKCLDQILIDELNERFILDIGAVYYWTDDYDDWYKQMDSSYVSRFVFDLILEGLKEKGFKELIMKNN